MPLTCTVLPEKSPLRSLHFPPLSSSFSSQLQKKKAAGSTSLDDRFFELDTDVVEVKNTGAFSREML